MKAVFLNEIVLPPVRDNQYARIEQDDVALRREHLEVIDRRSCGQHNALGVLDEALIIAPHAQLVVEQPRRNGHFAEAVGVDHVQRKHSLVRQCASPPTARGCSCLFVDPCKETITGDEQLTPKAHGGEALAVRQLIALDAAHAEHFGGFLDG